MEIKKLVLFLLVFLSVGFLIGNSAFTEESANIKLSYKILESQSNDTTLIMTVKLRVQNTGIAPIYAVTATNTYTNNITIDAGKIDIGDIEAGKTAISLDSFTITMKFASADQESPQKEAVWLMEYSDVNENTVVEEVVLN